MATASTTTLQQPAVASAPNRWLFSAPVDLSVFLGSAVLALILLVIGSQLGAFNTSTPDWVWVPAVLLVDVAHVYATGFRAYLDPVEFRRRPRLYTLIPVVSFLLAVAVYHFGALIFWRALAYLAVFHFVRQQYGWVALYRSRLGEHDRFGRWLDSVTIYAATLYPLIYWHAHLPRRFWWFLTDDFYPILPRGADHILAPLYWAIIFAYLGRSAYRLIVLKKANPGKDIVVITTAVCWYAGIVAFNSDFAFTVTNVLIHGIPYLALIYFFEQRRWQDHSKGLARNIFMHGPFIFLGTLWLCAYGEEVIWDRAVWHDRAWLFGSSWDVEALKAWLVPLLAVPQMTHYLLDGFLWRKKSTSGLFQPKERRE